MIAQKKYEEALKITDDLLKKNPQQVDVLKMKSDILESKRDKTASIVSVLSSNLFKIILDLENEQFYEKIFWLTKIENINWTGIMQMITPLSVIFCG